MTPPNDMPADTELREQLDKALDDFERQIRIDITNHISGDKSRNAAFSHFDARKQLERIVKARDAVIRIDELYRACEGKPRDDYYFTERLAELSTPTDQKEKE